MTAPRAFTANTETLGKVCDAALEDPRGVILLFEVSKYGSLEACATLSRRFSQGFYAMVARMRRHSERALNEHKTIPRDSAARGMYDALVMYRTALTNGEGWKIEVLRKDIAEDDLVIISASTGEPIEQMGAGKDERSLLIDKMTFRKGEFTTDDWDRFDELESAHAAVHGSVFTGHWSEAMVIPRAKCKTPQGLPTPGAITPRTPSASTPPADEFEALLEGDGDLFGDGD